MVVIAQGLAMKTFCAANRLQDGSDRRGLGSVFFGWIGQIWIDQTIPSVRVAIHIVRIPYRQLHHILGHVLVIDSVDD
jgi:hypothetical protein